MSDKEYAEILKGLLVPIHAEPAMDRAIELLEQEPILDKLTEIIEPLRHLAFDEMSDVEWQILQVIDKYAEQEGK